MKKLRKLILDIKTAFALLFVAVLSRKKKKKILSCKYSGNLILGY